MLLKYVIIDLPYLLQINVNMYILICHLQGFFDTLRMEIAGSGVNILTICPGPVASEISSNAFAEDLNRVSIPSLCHTWNVLNPFSEDCFSPSCCVQSAVYVHLLCMSTCCVCPPAVCPPVIGTTQRSLK